MRYYPLKLSYVTKSPIWGGTKLASEWGKRSEQPTIGESWELTVREKEMSAVVNGSLAGKTLGELIASDPVGMMGNAGAAGVGFPLLVKLIDAQDRLSVQVHPDDAYASRVENDRGKTEMWVIVGAEPGAEIICGLADGVTVEDLSRAVADGKIESVLKHQPVKAGEVYFIPSGLAHAIGKGVFIAEIQQNCDLTYRVYDYNRRQKDGTLRELHVAKALDVIRPFSDAEIEAIRYEAGKPESADVLANCRYFRVERISTQDGGSVVLPACPKMRHLLCVGGSGILRCDGEDYPVARGDSFFLPAALPAVTLAGSAILLQSEV